MRALVDGPRLGGHRNRAGKSRVGLLFGSAVLLAEHPSSVALAQGQTTLPPVKSANTFFLPAYTVADIFAMGDGRRISLSATVKF